MSAYTPGPWSVMNGFRPGIESDNIGFSVVVFGLEDDDAGVFGRSRSEAKANAILIAAAPDLLSALQHLLRHSGIADVDQRDKDKQDQDVERAARAAIAKATGEA